MSVETDGIHLDPCTRCTPVRTPHAKPTRRFPRCRCPFRVQYDEGQVAFVVKGIVGVPHPSLLCANGLSFSSFFNRSGRVPHRCVT